MITSKCHYCWEGEAREILLVVFTRFLRFSKEVFCRKSPILVGRNANQSHLITEPKWELNTIVFNIIALIFMEQHLSNAGPCY